MKNVSVTMVKGEKMRLIDAECAAGFHFFNTREEAKNDKY